MAKLVLTQDKNPIERIRQLSSNIAKVEGGDPQFDVTQVDYITPLTVLPLAMLISRYRQNRPIDICSGNPAKLAQLLAIGFPSGVPYSKLGDNPNVVPICNVVFDSSSRLTPIEALEAIAQKYGDLVMSHLKEHNEIADNYRESVLYFLSELCDNISEHSEAQSCWVFAIFWPNRRELEICIADDGIGLRRRYDRAGIGTKDHVDALTQAIKGISSKSPDRGYGIGSSIRLFTSDDLKGQVCLISGNACYFKEAGLDPRLGHIPVNWHGFIFSARLHAPTKRVSVIPYAQ